MRGLELPDGLKRPALMPGLDFYLSAFNELSTCRPIGMAAGPIPWTAIVAYAQSYGMDEEAEDYLRQMVRALDGVFLDFARGRADD